MATPSDGVTAALARVDAAAAQHDAAALTKELKAWLGSELVVARCCEALKNTETARVAAASADALRLLLEVLRRRAHCAAVVKAAWWALYNSLHNAEAFLGGLYDASVEAAVEHGALELALATACDTTADVEMVTTSLAVFYRLVYPKHLARALQLGGVEARVAVHVLCHGLRCYPTQAAAQATKRFPAKPLIQGWACNLLGHLVIVPDGAQRVRDAGGGELVVAALRTHAAHPGVAQACCLSLYNMLEHGLASSIDVEAAASLASAALRAHPSDEYVQMNATLLAKRLLECRSTPLVDGASPERAALARVAELKGRRDFASLERDMDAFPECEELQRDGCDAIYDILEEGGSHEEAAAAGAIECVVRSLDLYPYSANTQHACLAALANLTFLLLRIAPAAWALFVSSSTLFAPSPLT